MQVVNLYHGVLLPKPEKLPILYLVAALLVTLLLSGFWMYSSWNQFNQLQNQQKTLQKTEAQLQAQVESLISQIPSAAQEAKMQQNIKNLQLKLADSNSLSKIVSRLEKKYTPLFSGVFKDLSTLPSDDFWFTEIQLNEQGIGLTGKTYSSKKIADLVTRLQLLPHTQRAQFGQLIIERESANKRVATFSLSPPSIEVLNVNH